MTIGHADISANVIADELALTEPYDSGESDIDSGTELLKEEVFTFVSTLMNRDNRCARR